MNIQSYAKCEIDVKVKVCRLFYVNYINNMSKSNVK